MELLYSILLLTEFGLAVPIFILLFFIRAPYGKFLQKGWGAEIHAAPSWVLMELPACIIPLIFFLFSGKTNQPVYLVFLGVWQLHYIQRTFVYPAILNRACPKSTTIVDKRN
ncbi:MAG: hypothetical protein KAQ69_02995 [Spirochaetales bacterium]|nr:hypothetical protein [Spirochaetales bacterium]